MKNGYIFSLTLTNFQTFKHSTFTFNSLNFILGPNGSGKSTISNAICLIFGGTPKTIGKSKNIKEFIRFGSHDCKIEVEIWYDDQKIILSRGFSIANNFWYINNEIVKKCEYEKCINKLNININNLCQYLPQERVAEFCKMSSDELMINTLISMHRQDLVDTINNTIGLEITLKDLNVKENMILNQKSEINILVNKIDKDMEKVLEKENKIKKIEMMELKKVYLEYDMLVKDYKRINFSLKVLQQNYIDNTKELEDLNTEIEKVENNPLNKILQKDLYFLLEFDKGFKILIDDIKKINTENEMINIDEENINKVKEKRILELDILKKGIEESRTELQIIKGKILEDIREGGIFNVGESEGIGSTERMENNSIYKRNKYNNSTNTYKTNDVYNDTTNTNRYSDMIESLYQTNNIDTLFIKFDNTLIDEVEDDLFKNKKKINEVQKKCAEIKREVDIIEEEKRRMEEMKERRLEQLKKYSYETYKGVQFIREGSYKFEDEIIEPCFLNINIKDERFINEVEMFLNYHVLTSFICKNPNDFEIFCKILKDEKRLGINVVEKIKKVNYHKNDNLSKMGFDGFILDFIDARQEIKDFLVVSSHLDEVPVSKKDLDEKLIFEKSSYRRIAVNNKYIEIKKSKYSEKDFVISSNEIRGKKIFSSKPDLSELDNKLSKFNLLRQKYKKELEDLYKLNEILQNKLKKMYDHKKKFDIKVSESKGRINLYRFTLDGMRNKNIQIKQYEENTDIKIKEKEIIKNRNLLNQRFNKKKEDIIKHFKNQEYLNKYRECIKQYKDINSEYNKLQLLFTSKNNLERQNVIVQNSIEEHGRIKKSLREKFSEKKEMLKSKNKVILGASLKDCKVLVGTNIAIDNNNIPTDIDRVPTGTNTAIDNYIKEYMNNLPNTIEELIQEIRKEKAQVQFITVDDLIKDEYKDKVEILDNINKNLDMVVKHKTEHQEEVTSKKEEISKHIKEIVERINKTFGILLKKIGCDGRVEFEYEGLKCKQWKINILVKFRNTEKLEKLCAHRQSGGEKSVSTILYLLSLQSIDDSPFRLVDEINQGMDKYNEKNVLDILFDMCEKDKETQFFIISPKLVEGLKFNKCMKVIVLFSDQSSEISKYGKKPLW